MKKRKIFGYDLGLRKMVVVLVVLNMCWGEVEDIMDLVLVGSNFNLHLIL